MMAYTHEYSSTYYPPAPVVEMMVRDVERKDPEICVTGTLDYGSDVTMIPIDVLEAVGAQFVEKRQIRGVSGFGYPVNTYFVTVRIGPHTIYAIEVVALESGDETLIGRDVLNHLIITLNGLASVVEVEA